MVPSPRVPSGSHGSRRSHREAAWYPRPRNSDARKRTSSRIGFERARPSGTRSDRGNEVLTVTSARLQNGRPVIGFEGFETIEDVERLTGLDLRIPEDSLLPLSAGAYYVHDLVGCVVETILGEPIGEVTRVEGGAGASVLSVEGVGAKCSCRLPPISVSRSISERGGFGSTRPRAARAEPEVGSRQYAVRHHHHLSLNDRNRSG